MVGGDVRQRLGVGGQCLRQTVPARARQVGQHPAGEVEHRLRPVRHEVRHARRARVDVRSPEGGGRHVLGRDRPHDAGAGEEHVCPIALHDHDVGQRGRVRCPAGAGSEHEAELRHPARERDVGTEDRAVTVERRHSLLDARPARVDQPHHRVPGPARVGDDARDLGGVDLAEGATERRRVLGEHGDLPAVDAPDPGDDPVARGPLVRHAERVRAVACPATELRERTGVGECPDPGTGIGAPVELHAIADVGRSVPVAHESSLVLR